MSETTKPRGRLVLTRRVGGKAWLTLGGKPLGTVQIIEVKGDKVRLCFDLPTVDIHRDERTPNDRPGPPPPS